jgi:hypothetical protein
VWHPPQYYWTPSGYIFVDGYWDWPFEERGLVFAPVYFNQPLWQDAGWRYRPRFVVGFDSFFDCAFVYGGGFYFGNYYDPFYSRLGYRPWYHGRGRYDPVFAHHGWQHHRNNPNWVSGAQQTYANRSAGRAAAPRVAMSPLSQVTQVKLAQATPTQLERQRTSAQATQQLAVRRQKMDASVVSQGTANFRGPENRSLRLTADTQAPQTPSKGPAPKTLEPRIVATPSTTTPTLTPRAPTPKIDVNPTPRINPTPTPKVNPTPTPPINPAPTPKVNPTPTSPINPAPTPKINQPPVNPAPVPAPRINPPPAPAPKVSPPPAPAPRVSPPPAPPPRVSPPPAPPPRVSPPPAPPPRVSPPAPRPAPPAPRPSPPPRKTSVAVDPPKAAARPASPPARSVTTPAPAPRVSAPPPRSNPAPRASAPPPRSNPAPRVSAPPPRSNPAPAKSSPPAQASNGKKR